MINFFKICTIKNFKNKQRITFWEKEGFCTLDSDSKTSRWENPVAMISDGARVATHYALSLSSISAFTMWTKTAGANYYVPAHRVGGIERLCASDVCLSVAYIGPKSRTERPRKTKIDTEVAHVTRDSDTTFKVKRSTCRGRGHIVAASRRACWTCAAARN